MAKQSKTRKRKSIPRQTRRFQLRLDHEQDSHVKEILDYARSEKREVTIIRDGVQLEHALEQGDIALLLQRFPWIADKIKTDEDRKRDEEMNSKMDLILAQQTTGGYTMQSYQPSLPTPKPMDTPPVAVVTVAKAVDADTIADNFLSLLF